MTFLGSGPWFTLGPSVWSSGDGPRTASVEGGKVTRGQTVQGLTLSGLGSDNKYRNF